MLSKKSQMFVLSQKSNVSTVMIKFGQSGTLVGLSKKQWLSCKFQRLCHKSRMLFPVENWQSCDEDFCFNLFSTFVDKLVRFTGNIFPYSPCWFANIVCQFKLHATPNAWLKRTTNYENMRKTISRDVICKRSYHCPLPSNCYIQSR